MTYNLGYYKRILEGGVTNTLAISSLANDRLPLVSLAVEEIAIRDINDNDDKTTILYLSSEIKDKNGDPLNRIGVRFEGSRRDKDMFFIEVCDSVNRKCTIASTSRKEDLEKIKSGIDF